MKVYFFIFKVRLHFHSAIIFPNTCILIKMKKSTSFIDYGVFALVCQHLCKSIDTQGQ